MYATDSLWRAMGVGDYTFGGSGLAAARLALLAGVFASTTARFLSGFQANPPRLVVDLGCGPGFTTGLLRDVLSPERVIAVDSSPAFVEEAAQRLGENAMVLEADVLDLPGSIVDADVIFARFLLTHLADPLTAVQAWLGRLAPDGVVAVEEVESITTGEPVLAAYLELQRRMLAANHNRLEVGPLMDEAAEGCGWVVGTEIVALTPSTPTVARMFAMNFETWRSHPAVVDGASRGELDEIAHGLAEIAATKQAAPITWELRQLRITSPGPARL